MTSFPWRLRTCTTRKPFLDNLYAVENSILIRPMDVADVPAVTELDRESFSLPWTEKSFTYEITQNQLSIPLVAETDAAEGKAIAGFIVVWLIVDEAHIGTIAVAEPYRQKGIAEGLIAAAFAQARLGGAIQAYLEVRAGNRAARRLYQKLGFVTDGIRKGYYQDNHEDAVLMSLSDLSKYG